MKQTIIFALGIAFCLEVAAQTPARLFRYPDVSQTQITFSYGGDIWIVAKEGGIATRLSSPAGNEVFPKFSPDGKTIAFSGNYDGNVDIYTMPAGGGLPNRVTHHGMSDYLQDWYPTGQDLLYTTSMHSEKQRFSQFYKISKEGGLPVKLPIAFGEFGSLSPDGKWIAFTDKSRVFRTWKRYEGGMAADIWMFNLETLESENVSEHVANDELPMWHKDRIYFLSDRGREKRYNIWYYDINAQEISQVTKFDRFDVHFPSIGPQEIVYEAGGKMYLLDLDSHESREVEIQVMSDLISIKPRKETVQEYVRYADISPDGNRVVVEARGELFSLPAKKGSVQNLTRASGSAERYPAWSPDGKYVAYWSDASGEYELTLKELKIGGETRKVTDLGPGYRYQIYWSPDSKHVGFVDQSMKIQICNIESGEITEIDQEIALFEGGLRGFAMDWSSDSRYIAYHMTLDNSNAAIFIHDFESNETHQVTSGFYSDHFPVFDPDGKYLYISTNRSFSPVYSDFDGNWSYPNATGLAAISLRNDVPSPLAPSNDTVAVASKEDSEEDEAEKKEGVEEAEEDENLEIDFDGFERRLVMLPPKPGNIGRLAAVSGKVIYARYSNQGEPERSSSVSYYDLEEEEEKVIVSDASFYKLSGDRKKLLVRQNNQMAVVDVAAEQKLEDAIALEDMEMTIVPMEEWNQIFNDAWRFERDFFYDKTMHGVDWDGLGEQYRELLPYCINRSDVNFVIGELIGELNASHAYRGGGDEEEAESRNVGYLGVDWTKNNGHLQIEKIVRGADWNDEVRSPLDMPGVDAREGDYVLAVNGVPMNEFRDPWDALEGLAGKTVELTLNDKPNFDDARTVIVEPLNTETRLRHLAWIEKNRKEVEEESDGKIGYIYVPSTGIDGQNELVRQFYAQWNKEGLIVDERFNNGGQIPDRFIELLNRKPLAYWSVRDGKNWQSPRIAHFGSMAMLINGWSGSGGDALPDYFRKAGLGPLIGTRTWGGLIGISGSPTLVDGGAVTVPTFRMYHPDGTWFREGHGVDPDIEVKEDHTQLAKGIDTQLQAAIEQVMKQIEEKGPIHPKPPATEKRT